MRIDYTLRGADFGEKQLSMDDTAVTEWVADSIETNDLLTTLEKGVNALWYGYISTMPANVTYAKLTCGAECKCVNDRVLTDNTFGLALDNDGIDVMVVDGCVDEVTLDIGVSELSAEALVTTDKTTQGILFESGVAAVYGYVDEADKDLVSTGKTTRGGLSKSSVSAVYEGAEREDIAQYSVRVSEETIKGTRKHIVQLIDAEGIPVERKRLLGVDYMIITVIMLMASYIRPINLLYFNMHDLDKEDDNRKVLALARWLQKVNLNYHNFCVMLKGHHADGGGLLGKFNVGSDSNTKADVTHII